MNSCKRGFYLLSIISLLTASGCSFFSHDPPPPPVIILIEPADALQTASDTIPVRGRVENGEAERISLERNSQFLGGLDISSFYNYEFNFPAVALVMGKNIITVSCLDTEHSIILETSVIVTRTE